MKNKILILCSLAFFVSSCTSANDYSYYYSEDSMAFIDKQPIPYNNHTNDNKYEENSIYLEQYMNWY